MFKTLDDIKLGDLMITGADSIKNEIKKYRILIRGIESKTKSIQEEIKVAQDNLDKDHIRFARQLRALEIDVDSLKAQARNMAESGEIAHDPMFEDGEGQGSIEPEQFESEEELRSECKKLFNKIAPLCHPDTCEDENLHDYFKEAREAMDAYDYTGLQDIYEKIENKESYVDKNEYELRREFELVYKSWEQKRNYLSSVMQSPGYRITQNYNSEMLGNILQATQDYLNLVFDKMKTLNRTAEKLKEKIGQD